MKIKILKKPRKYNVGLNNNITIKDLGRVELKPNEQLTFANGKYEYDLCKKDWGFYSTPSINKRLKKFNFEVYLVKNSFNNIYLWTIEKKNKNKFHKYLKDENHVIVTRLDNFLSEGGLIRSIANNKFLKKCDHFSKKKKIINKDFKKYFKYNRPPAHEPNYFIKDYKREILKCNICGHFIARHKINTSNFYKRNYSTISHGNELYKKFKRILKLKKQSDNYHRVKRVLLFFKDLKKKKIKLLDIGSGLGIFLYSLKRKVNWTLFGIEPDMNFAKFSKFDLELNIENKNLNLFKKKNFDIITLNKVLEHVKNPINLLCGAKNTLGKGGYIYIEVPDGTSASNTVNGKEREEFFLDHLHIFSIKSLSDLIIASGMSIEKIESIKEKSGKLSIYAFIRKN